MSNIIKSGRVRSQSILDLSNRAIPQVEILCEELEVESHCEELEVETVTEPILNSEASNLETIREKENELKVLESQIQERLADADNKIEVMLTEAVEKAEAIKKEARDQQTKVIADAYQKQEEILKQAEEEAQNIRRIALDEKKSMLNAVEGEVVEVIITLLQHIISEEMTGHIEWLKLVVRRLLLEEEISEEVTLLVSSHTMTLLEKEKEQFIASLSKLAAIEVNEALNDTTCILVTSQGNIEYDISEGLRKVVSELRILKDLT